MLSPATYTALRVCGLWGAIKEHGTWKTRLEAYKLLGFLSHLHARALRKDKVLAVKRSKTRYIGKYTGQSVTLTSQPVTQKEAWTKEGWAYYVFLTFEDETDLYETVIFPQIYGRFLYWDMARYVWNGELCQQKLKKRRPSYSRYFISRFLRF
jgi:hypothetical protein